MKSIVSKLKKKQLLILFFVGIIAVNFNALDAFKLKELPKNTPTATITIDADKACINTTSKITFTAENGTAPYTFTYTVNNSGVETTLTTTATANTVDLNLNNSTAGSFIYKLISVTDATSTTTAINQEVTLTVGTPPTVSFTFDNDNTCSGTTVNFTSTVIDGTSPFEYLWDFGDGVTSTLANPTHQFNDAIGSGITDYKVLLKVTDINGCETIKENTVQVIDQLDISFFDIDSPDDPFNNCSQASLSGSGYTINVGNNTSADVIANIMPGSYKIDWGDGVIEEDVSFPIEHTYTEVGAFDMIISATATNGCVATRLFQIKNTTNPAGGFPSPGDTRDICAPTKSLEFGITDWGTNPPGTEYIVDFGDGTRQSYNQAQLEASSAYNAADPANSSKFPTPHIYTTGSCNESNGQFTAVLTIRNACSSTVLSVSGISVLEAVEPSFEAEDNVCVNTPVDFTNTSILGNSRNCVDLSSFTWNFGDGSPLVEDIAATRPINKQHTYTTPGNYTVILSAKSSCGDTVTFEKEICVEPEITPAFNLDIEEGCLDLIVKTDNITDETGLCSNATYLWSVNYSDGGFGTAEDFEFLAGTDATSKSPEFKFNAAGLYTLTLEATTTCGAVTTSKVVTVKDTPQATINTIIDYCGTATISPTAVINGFTPDATDLTYSWTFTGADTVTTSTLENPVDIVYSTPGNYEVTLEVTNSCGTSTITTETFEVFDTTVLTNTNLTQEICSSQPTTAVTLTADKPGATFSWSAIATAGITGFTNSGTSNTIPSEIITNTSATTGTITYTVTPTLGTCDAEPVEFTVLVNPAPVFTKQPVSSAVCINETPNLLEVTVDRGIGTASYQWYSNATNSNIGGTPIAGATNSSYQPSGATLGETFYYVEVNYNSGSCSLITSNPAKVTVNEYPAIADATLTINSLDTFNFDPSTIAGNTVPLNTTYTWATPIATPLNSVSGASAATAQANISQTLENLTPNAVTINYTITPKFATCEGAPFNLEIIINAELKPNAVITNNLCFNDATGAITTNVVGGTPFATGNPYLISWQGPNGFTSSDENISNLTAGDYTLTIEDGIGGTFTRTYTVGQPNKLEIVTNTLENITCFGQGNGTVDVSITGGTAPYAISWSTTDGAGIIAGAEDQNTLQKGTYILNVVDANNCETSTTYTITEPQPLALETINTQDIFCFDDSTGQIAINVTGGTPKEVSAGVFEYTYAWQGPDGFTAATQNINSLKAGSYTVKVTDNLGCEIEQTFVLNQPQAIEIEVTTTNVTCSGSNNGNIDVSITGGVQPYDISWSNLAEGTSLTNLSGGTYTITVTDANNCVTKQSIVIDEPSFFIEPEVNNISCNGAENGRISLNLSGGVAPIAITWSDGSTSGLERNNLPAGTYTVSLTDSNPDQCPINQTFIITEPEPLTATETITDATDCTIASSGAIDLNVLGGVAPYSYNWSNGQTTKDVANLNAGTYTVEITDANLCSITKEFEIFRQDELTVNVRNEALVNCSLKDIQQQHTANATGGFPPYTYAWSFGTVSGADNEVMTTGTNGAYTLTVTDSRNCVITKTITVNLEELGTPGFNISATGLDTYNLLSVKDPIQFTSTATGDVVTIQWDFGDGSPIVTESNPTHTYDEVGEFTVKQLVKYTNCEYELEQTLNITLGYSLLMPNAFTPNGDGFNDYIRPSFTGMETVEIQIFDSWGNTVYKEKAPILTGWDGKINGKLAENGNYLMRVVGTTFYNVDVIKTTSVTLLR